MLNSISDLIFKEVIWRHWLKFISASKSPRTWKRIFEETAIKTDTVPPHIAVKLSSCPSVMKLMLDTFKPERNVPSAEDFAISIYFELSHKDYLISEFTQIPLCKIRNFASSVRQGWLLAINNSFVLKTCLKEVRDKHPSDFMNNSASCPPIFETVLNDGIEFRKCYFMNYSTPDATEKIIVWLPSPSGYVEYDPNHRINVEVNLNASVGADIGFFRSGYDYSLRRLNGDDEWLQVACRDDKFALETMQFKSLTIGRLTKNILWAS